MMENINKKQIIILTGFIGLLAATLTGVGEFLLNYDPLSRYSDTTYTYMLGGSTDRETIGHFFGVFGAPLYLIGMWHIYLMLKPGHKFLAFFGFLVSAYGFIIGADWLSSRASIGAIVHFNANTGADVSSLVDLYKLRYESLLQVVRVTTLALSLIYIFLILRGKTHYAKWQVILNPIVLLALSFVAYKYAPDIGKYIVPIALNVGFFLFFLMSSLQALTIKEGAAELDNSKAEH